MNLISFILPSRNNLKYLKQAYHSIRKNSEHPHEICIASDASTDGTVEWVQEIMKKDENVKLHINEGPERLGHTILYDTLIYDYATHDRVMIFHADMYLCPKADEEIDKYLEPGKVVSLTRIEPPLHPDGPEKILVKSTVRLITTVTFKFHRILILIVKQTSYTSVTSDRKSTRLNSSHSQQSRMPSSA